MKNIPKLEPKEQKNLSNDSKPDKSEAELEAELESLVSPEVIFNFVRMHYMHDDGNDTPPNGAELEEAFRSFIFQLGYRGPKVEFFIKRAMTSIDDYDYTDKFDNIDQTLGSSYGKRIFGSEIDNDLLSDVANLHLYEEPDLGTKNAINNKPEQEQSFKDKHKNNPFYIDPFAPNKPY